MNENYNELLYEIEDWLPEISGISIAAIYLLIWLFVMAIGAATYLLTAISLFNMAKSAGHKYAWMAWVPVCNTYLIVMLPGGEFSLFPGFIKFKKRLYAFLTYLLAPVALMILEFVIIILASLFMITGIGAIVSIFLIILFYILVFAMMIAFTFFGWRFYKDLFDTFNPEKKGTNMAISIIGMFGTFVIPFAAFTILVYMLIIMKNKPVYGEGNFYNVSVG